MSTAHTPGAIEWSESPVEANRFGINVKGHRWLLSILHNGEPLVEQQRENMRRLVACWNACDGTNVALLEGFASGLHHGGGRTIEAVWDSETALIHQSNKLLSALESAKHMLERDYIDDDKMKVIRKCDLAIKAAGGTL